MIKQKKHGNLIIISGTTCAGKGTVIQELLNRNSNLSLSVSYTSRKKRDGEIEGKDYYFINKEQFEDKIKSDEMLEYEIVHQDHYYGTPKKEVKKLLDTGKDVILELDVKGAQHVKEMFPETILIFILAPSMEIVKERIKARGKENNEQIIKRFQAAYQEINEIPKYNYVVVNDVLEDAVKKVETILLSETCRVDRIEEIAVENKEEIIHEFLMDKEFDNSPLYEDKLN
ncbi:MAG: guanylate kinase [Bacilli bacterium]|nr:guanylate kinase [Bacilli bacterium]